LFSVQILPLSKVCMTFVENLGGDGCAHFMMGMSLEVRAPERGSRTIN